jgi:hypothetical protein
MWIQQLICYALVALAAGQTNAPSNITSDPGYDNLSQCAQCALQLPGSSGNQCLPRFVSVIQNLGGCTGGITWACACTPTNLGDAISRIPSLSCSPEDQSSIRSVLRNFCNSIPEGDFVSTTTPSTVEATQSPSITLSANIPPPSQQATASAGAPDSGNAGSFTSSWDDYDLS